MASNGQAMRGSLSAKAQREGSVVALVLVVLAVFFWIKSPFFMTSENISNVLVQSVFVLIVATGMTFVLISGGIDLSVGSTMGLSAGISALTMMHGVPVLLALILGLATGALIGFINGLLIARAGISDFIATLAMLGIVRGILQLITTKQPLREFGSKFFARLSGSTSFWVPVPVLIALGIIAISAFLLWNTAFGRRVFAIGMSRNASHIAGVDVVGIRVRVYVLSGVLAAAAGILLSSRLSSVQPELGTGYELTAIAAAVIGGTSLSGGRGRLSGTVAGALLLGVLENGLRLLGVNAYYFTIVTGVIIVVAVAAERLLTGNFPFSNPTSTVTPTRQRTIEEGAMSS